LVIVVAVIVATGFLAIIATVQSRENARREAESAATSSTQVTSPYDVTELTGELNMDLLKDATFVSIMVPNAEGRPTSYMVDAGSDAAKNLIAAVRKAPEVKVQGSQSPASTAGAAAGSTLTFMLPSRQIVTFSLDLDTGTITRQGRAWHPRGDLSALIDAATTAPRN
jgi:hypothetical protein